MGLARRILDRGWADKVDTGGKHSALLNATFLAGERDLFRRRIDDVLNEPKLITEPNIADSSSRIRPLVIAGHIDVARAGAADFLRRRVTAGGVTQHTTALSTPGWVFADSAYMVAPSQAIIGNTELMLSDLKGIWSLLAQEDGLVRHVLNANVPREKSYIGIDVWIDGTTWGRANGWWVAAVVDSLEVVPPQEWDKDLLKQYEKTTEALIRHQDNGFWRCTVDDSFAPVDTSATVMIAYALLKGHQLGLGSAEHELAAFSALEQVLRHHFDFRTATLRHQQIGPLVVNVASQNPRYLHEGNPYGQGFLAGLYAMAADGVQVRDLGLTRLTA